MAIPELELKRAEAALARFCNRVPAAVRHQVSNHWLVRANQVTLFERRPVWNDPSRHTQRPFVRFRWDPSSQTWALRWFDRNAKSHSYEGFEAVRRFEDLVAEVESDPTGIFLG